MRRSNNRHGTVVADWRNQKTGPDYRPWLTVRDVPSKGLSTRVLGWKTERVHHFFSRLEENYFYMLEWSSAVIDIREQFPIPVEQTTTLAQELGIRHSSTRKGPITMTSDFVITLKSEDRVIYKVRSVKPSADLASNRTIQKLQIERQYWKGQAIDWTVITEKQISAIFANNVKWVHQYRFLDFPGLTEAAVLRTEEALAPAIQDHSRSLSAICLECDDRLGQPAGTSLRVVRHLLATRRWTTDMSKAIDPCQPVVILPQQPIEYNEPTRAIYQLANRVA